MDDDEDEQVELSPQVTQLSWSAQLTLSADSAHVHLPGDKILLPQSALEQLLAAVSTSSTTNDRHNLAPSDPFHSYTDAYIRNGAGLHRSESQHLPHPLTFRLTNPSNGRAVYCGVREFSGPDNSVVLSDFLLSSLSLLKGSSTQQVLIAAHQLPKGRYVKLRPLEAGYDEDWKPLLEQHLSKNFTTLTRGELLTVPGPSGAFGPGQEYRFLIDEFKPEGNGVCVVDTDIELDIEALNEDQARETLKRIAERHSRKADTDGGTSAGGELSYFKAQAGQVLPGQYVDYEIVSWNRSVPIDIQLSSEDDPQLPLDLLVSPFSPRQRERPRIDTYTLANFDDSPNKKITISPTNVDFEEAEALWISVYSFSAKDTASGEPSSFTLKCSPGDTAAPSRKDLIDAPSMEDNETQCKNCLQVVPKQSLVLHENFCLRNNILCPKGCGKVFQKRSTQYKDHWHCPHDSSHGNSHISLEKHNLMTHPSEPFSCRSCETTSTFDSLPLLALHRTSTCPGKLILCRFCHLQVPQEGDANDPNPSAEQILTGLTVHELADGARTTECHLCQHIVKLRDLDTHLRHHDLERKSRPEPRLCRNVNCGRTLDGANRQGDTRAATRMGQEQGNDNGLCNSCFGPLYVSLYDPEGKALRRRVERRYMQQLLSGCGKSYCRNEYCRNGRNSLGISDGSAVPAKEALTMVKPLLDGFLNGSTPLHFCVDEPSQRRRTLAEHLQAAPAPGDRAYSLPWTVAALEAESGGLDAAREWLKNFAPGINE